MIANINEGCREGFQSKRLVRGLKYHLIASIVIMKGKQTLRDQRTKGI